MRAMGMGTQPLTKRNFQIYELWSSGKKSRQEIQDKYNISYRRFYQIVEWVKNRKSDNAVISQ